jgi:hypothetical protein
MTIKLLTMKGSGCSSFLVNCQLRLSFFFIISKFRPLIGHLVWVVYLKVGSLSVPTHLGELGVDRFQ